MSSPLDEEDGERDVVGLNDMPIISDDILFCEDRLSVTVGTLGVSCTAPAVRSTGPIPRIPST